MRRARDLLYYLWPFFAAFAVAAVIVAATVAVWSIFDQRTAERVERERVASLAADVRQVAEDTKAAAEANTRLLRDTLPCVAGDPRTPPEHPSCVREARSRITVDKALQDIANEAHAQHQHLVNVVAELVGKRAPPLPRTAPRPAMRPPAGGSQPPAAVPPPTTTTTRPAPVNIKGCIPKEQKRGKCK